MLDKRRKKLLRDILNTQSKSKFEEQMDKLILSKINAMKDSSIVVEHIDGNILVTKGTLDDGEAYPCVVSHKDTVHAIIDNYGIVEHSGIMYAMDYTTYQQTGIGGDDKVGIFITLEMMRHLEKGKFCFFAEEEIGLVGSRRAPDEFFQDIGYAIQCDRKSAGYNKKQDFVNSIGGKTLFGNKFKKAIKPILTQYGYSITSGGSTDVSSIKDKVDVCVCNMSCGYYRPHTSSEVISMSEVHTTLSLVEDLVGTLGNSLWHHKAKEKKYTPAKSWGSNYNKDRYNCKKCKRLNKWDAGSWRYFCTHCMIDEHGNKVVYKKDEKKTKSNPAFGYQCSSCDRRREWNQTKYQYTCKVCDEHHCPTCEIKMDWDKSSLKYICTTCKNVDKCKCGSEMFYSYAKMSLVCYKCEVMGKKKEKEYPNHEICESCYGTAYLDAASGLYECRICNNLQLPYDDEYVY